MNQLPSEDNPLLAVVPPLADTVARTSLYVRPTNYEALRAIVLVGDASATGTLTLIKAASSSGGSSASIATAAYGGTGTAGDNFAHVMSLGQLDDFFDPDRPWFAIGLGEGVALTAAILEGIGPRYKKAPLPDQAANVTVVR